MNVPFAPAECDAVAVGPLELAFPSTEVDVDPGVSVSVEPDADAEFTTYDVVPSSCTFSAANPDVLDELDAEPSSTSAMDNTAVSYALVVIISCILPADVAAFPETIVLPSPSDTTLEIEIADTLEAPCACTCALDVWTAWPFIALPWRACISRGRAMESRALQPSDNHTRSFSM